MAIVKRIVCLANSRKPHGSCVAGKELSMDGKAGLWVRPVSSRESAEVSLKEQQYSDRSTPQLLDVMGIRLLHAQPSYHQKENWILDSQRRWTKVGRFSWADLPELCDTPLRLWVNGYSTSRGENDKLPLDIAHQQSSSLQLIAIDSMEIEVLDYSMYRRRVQGRFSYRGVDYWLWVTDPIYEEAYLAKANGTYPIGETYLTISLSEQFLNQSRNAWECYKLVAGIIEKVPE